MDLRPFLGRIAESAPEDWLILQGPLFRHGFSRVEGAEGKLLRVDVDAPPVGLVYRADVAITMLYGLVLEAAVDLPVPGPYRQENCRSIALDCFYCGGLVHREVLLKVGRQRCILPRPAEWTAAPQLIPERQAKLARLVHALCGPFTDFDEYFDSFPMTAVQQPWP